MTYGDKIRATDEVALFVWWRLVAVESVVRVKRCEAIANDLADEHHFSVLQEHKILVACGVHAHLAMTTFARGGVSAIARIGGHQSPKRDIRQDVGLSRALDGLKCQAKSEAKSERSRHFCSLLVCR